YDAMTSDRTYRQAMDEQQAIEEIKQNAGTQFDPDLAKIFVEQVAGRV
ncbi:MAG TPA: diguanylate cyclase, partial [Eubacteriaceae bacterium]|nr:diguanylate cyclase [Eubacteriaceae bacterium]